MNQCICGKPATRLVHVRPSLRALSDDRSKAAAEDIIRRLGMSKTPRVATCEDHRERGKDTLNDLWAEEISEQIVQVVLGPRRKAGS